MLLALAPDKHFLQRHAAEDVCISFAIMVVVRIQLRQQQLVAGMVG